MLAKKPTEEGFSNNRLFRCFSPRLFNGLFKLDEVRKKLKNEINSIHLMYKNVIPGKEEDTLLSYPHKKVISVLDIKKNSKYYLDFIKKFGLKNACEICKHPSTHKHHILERAYIDKITKGHRYYDIFKDNLANIMILCANHHDTMHEKHGLKLKPKELDRLIKRRIKLNRILLKIINQEMKIYNNSYDLLKKFKKRNERRVHLDFNRLIKKLKQLHKM